MGADKITGLTQTAAQINTSGDQTIIAAPGVGKQIVIAAMALQNESASATTILVKAGSTVIWRFLAQTQGQRETLSIADDREFRLGDNTPLVINLSGANNCNYSLSYWVEGLFK